MGHIHTHRADPMADVSYGFFPTGKELSSSVKWIKEHPVVATAAAVGATAISIVTYFRATTATPDETTTGDVRQRVVSWCDVHVKTDASRSQEPTKHTVSPTDCDVGLGSNGHEDDDALLDELQTLAITTPDKREAEDSAGSETHTKHDLQSASPQWGWYVAITPPSDVATPVSSLPRAITDPLHMTCPSSTTSSASLMGLKRTQSARLR
ncbi:hypothetical protein H310_04856 [Aphanomyces invadans]|uniref:Uncharacterized protein n=1 Tax=Aphanomyces invadans TaxID=157072 RepID=A0A024UAF5_9STRA|nr:hypothetical protein H310_04856 [Aphanomyces invadans]ETW03376.1 hypothetical protein H310_04856 [Aphanomyces invadans]|eukprot:XP_008867605.1 hypothetical protein H310_04856 [Aphanomyces invadans]